ncbi:Hint domain-containing protein [Sulfitobacter aquimarinus]|uniref:Hint domain-containing protein n=1 Tax=Sulfitobacter aquimarinus TaxID=3158557 RepID=UPI003F6EE9F4
MFTLDNGYRPVQWVGSKSVTVTSNTAPFLFETGTTGNHRPLLVSPNHRMLLCSTQADLMLGNPEVLIPAKWTCHAFVPPQVLV